MLLGLTGVLPTGQLWRILVIPAYLVALGAAILANGLAVSSNPLFWILSAALFLLPFAAIDLARRRFRDSVSPAA